MPLTHKEITDSLALLSIGEAYKVYLGPKDLAEESYRELSKCPPEQIEAELATVVMVSSLAHLHLPKNLLAQVATLAVLFNSLDEQTAAHLKSYCEKALKFHDTYATDDAFLKELGVK